MTEPTRETPTTKVSQDASVPPLIAPLEQGTESNLPVAKTPIDEFLKRNEEVLARDREEFQSYLVAKHEQATRKARSFGRFDARTNREGQAGLPRDRSSNQ